MTKNRDDLLSRRQFIEKTTIGTAAFIAGTHIPFARFLPKSWIPIALASDQNLEKALIETKDGLTLLNDRPINGEFPPHLLDDEITPVQRLFVRNNGRVPEMALRQDASQWKLTIDGEVKNQLNLNLEDLKRKFKAYTYQLTLECGGNGRAGFYPPAKGNQWTYGAIGCPEWTGVRLKDVLNAAGLKPSAVYTAYYGHDRHLSGDEKKVVISRGTPIAKALEDTTLLAYEMNGKPLSALHGFPLRIVCPGYPGSVSGKWIHRITIRDQVHDGPKMTGYSYRVPKNPVAPGTHVSKSDMKIIEAMPVKSLITFPKSGGKISSSEAKRFQVRGFAWTGQKVIQAVDVSFDFGQTWKRAKLSPQKNPFAWQRWSTHLELPSTGYYEIWARAQDDTGKAQPMVVPGWNPKGYLNNAMPRIAVTVEG